ncbi:DUF6702 family protein [uncultured Draconibacterium sp.]|uniref:DUF6702 family protein n=1 Tax=uncultured Draconibacterium sp. TaxID=1573823 RepID=UPI0025D716A2|nr:DUF6702 family protein [uncultured Draconibacterium sp.]
MNLNKIFVSLSFILFATISAYSHPFYVSICQVDYNEQNRSLEISLKVFADDLLLALEQEGHKKLYLGEAKENERTDEFIFSYLKNKIYFTVHNTHVPYYFIGKEVEKEVVWIYLEASGVSDFDKFEVDCTLLTEVYSDQRNIIQLSKNGIIKNLLLDIRKTTGTLEFKEN